MYDVKTEALIQAANYLNNNECISASNVINSDYPFIPVKPKGRNYTIRQMMEQFFCDGFIDRYSGKPLVNPGILRVMSELIPDAFPYQSHWKTDSCHMAYWDFQPTIDHICPISLGGKDTPENWATTSMVNNSAKGNFTLEQLGWTLKDKGDIKVWDGLSKVFIEIVDQNKLLLHVGRISDYYKATKEVLKEYNM